MREPATIDGDHRSPRKMERDLFVCFAQVGEITPQIELLLSRETDGQSI